MRNFLLLSALFWAVTIQAQTYLQSGTTNKTTVVRSTTISGPSVKVPDAAAKAIIDTVFAPALALACSDQPAVFNPGPDQGGFVTGSNSFFDVTKGQRIEFDEAFTFDVNGIVAGLTLDDAADATSVLDDVMLVAKVYTDDGDLGADDFLGDSDSIRIGDLGLDNTTFSFITFPFSSPVNVVGAESIIIAVDFINVYGVSDGSQEGGNIGIVSTGSDCGDGMNAFESFIDTTGTEMFFDLFSNWGELNVELFMGVIIDREPLVGTRTPIADYKVTVSPNPATDRLNISFADAGGQSVVASLLSADGRRLREQVLTAGSRSVSWSVEELPAGVYLYQLAGRAGVQTGKVVVW